MTMISLTARIRTALTGCLLAALAAASIPARAADIEIMAPAAPGGGYDRTSRAFEQALEKEKLGSATPSSPPASASPSDIWLAPF